MNNPLPVAIIGAGPVGLAAAAHLASRNQPFILFEAGATVAATILSWKHVRVFSPWKYNIDKAARSLLTQTSWSSPDDDELPTGADLYDRYLKPLAALDVLRDRIHLNSSVISVGRKNLDKVKTRGRDEVPFVIRVVQNGEQKSFEAKAVIDASGTWKTPNPVGSGGLYAVGELENSGKIFYGIPDVLGAEVGRYKNKTILVVGSGHSSIHAVLALCSLKEKYRSTEIYWVLRKQRIGDVYGGQENDQLPARGELGKRIEKLVTEGHIKVYTPFQVHAIRSNVGKLTIDGFQHEKQFSISGIDEIICNTGSRPDHTFLREVRLAIDPSLESVASLAALIDPNIHSCGTVRPHGEKELRQPEKEFYIVGSKSYGRAPTFLMATGYEQVRSVVAAIDGDERAASKVELDLPETGVCNAELSGSLCCGATVASVDNPATVTRKHQESTVIQQSTDGRANVVIETSSCCTPKQNETVCCTPSTNKEENNGACCAQPEDGSACCNK